ncbi:MAG TPA: HAMP domain-containing sensor histidine kinase [Xanthobacteraceae bacterium]|nr:HAMP domain-containing sensor histidine kinase [Xanthobacteraceae bacterium]
MLLAKTLRSTTFRLALISIAMFGAMVIALFGYVYWSTTNFVLSRSDHAIEAERATLRNVYETGGRDGLTRAIEQRDAEARLEGGIYLLADGSFAPVAGNIKKWPSALKAEGQWVDFKAEALNAKPGDGQAVFRARSEILPDGFHLLVGKDISDLSRFANKISTALIIALLLIFILAAVASVSVTRRTVGRIESINATSRAIMESGLGRRIPLRGTQDEWDHLAHNLNSMLERIEALMAEVRQVSDNVAHDLRTPLTRMRARLEKASVEKGDHDQDQPLISQTMADLDDVLRMFSSLMRISQIETTSATSAFRMVNLAEIATQVVELFDAAAESKGGRVEALVNAPVLVIADRDLLFDAVANLVDNAIKHGRVGGLVTVSVDRKDGEAVILVSDDGPGIPATEFEYVFKRFYRLERSRRTPGNGLGLSLVAAVARLHGVHITLSDNVPGLRVELHFPLFRGGDQPVWRTHGQPSAVGARAVT